MVADPVRVEIWTRAWALSRGAPPPTWEAGALKVDVGWPQQKARYVFSACTADVRNLAESIREPWILLKVCAAPDEVRSCLMAPWAIAPPRFMMTCDAPMAGGGRPLPSSYALAQEAEGSVTRVAVRAPDGEVAARGGLLTLDGFAIYDRIVTHEAHRRIGLATAVMKALEAIALARGARRNLLVATDQGRQLYDALGWRLHAPYTTALIPAAP